MRDVMVRRAFVSTTTNFSLLFITIITTIFFMRPYKTREKYNSGNGNGSNVGKIEFKKSNHFFDFSRKTHYHHYHYHYSVLHLNF